MKDITVRVNSSAGFIKALRHEAFVRYEVTPRGEIYVTIRKGYKCKIPKY